MGRNSERLFSLPRQVTYDYHDFSNDPAITSKIFTIGGNNLAANLCTTETRNISRAKVNGVATVTLDRVRTDVNGFNCGYNRFSFERRDDGIYLLSNDARTADGIASRVLREVDGGLLMRTASMQIGNSYGTGAALTVTRNSGVTDSAIVQKSTLLSVENVSVPYNGGTTYNGCLKVHLDRYSSEGFGGDLDQVSWYCAGVGLVKRVDGTGNTWTLTNINF